MSDDALSLWEQPDILLAIWEYIRVRNITHLEDGYLRYIPNTELLKSKYPHLEKPFYIGEYATAGQFEILADAIESIDTRYCQSNVIDLSTMGITCFSEYLRSSWYIHD